MYLASELALLFNSCLTSPANAVFPLLFYQLTFLEYMHITNLPFQTMFSMCFYFSSITCHWIEQQRTENTVWNPSSALRLDTACGPGPESGSLLLFTHHLWLPGQELLPPVHHTEGKWKADDSSYSTDQVQFSNPSTRLQPVSGHLEFEQQPSSKQENESSLVNQKYHKITEYPNLEGTLKDHWVQLQAPHRTTQNSNPVSESTVQALLEFWQPGAVPIALGRPFQGLTTLWWRTFFQPPTWHSLTQLHAIPLGPVAVTREQSSALPFHSPHEELPPVSLLCSGLNKPRDLSCSSYTLLSDSSPSL